MHVEHGRFSEKSAFDAHRRSRYFRCFRMISAIVSADWVTFNWATRFLVFASITLMSPVAPPMSSQSSWIPRTETSNSVCLIVLSFERSSVTKSTGSFSSNLCNSGARASSSLHTPHQSASYFTTMTLGASSVSDCIYIARRNGVHAAQRDQDGCQQQVFPHLSFSFESIHIMYSYSLRLGVIDFGSGRAGRALRR